jgi:hypothetical protein
LVPLYLKSYLGAPAWMIIGAVLLLVGTGLVLGAMTAGKVVGAVGVAVLVTSIVFICRGLVVWTEKIRLAGDHVARVTALSRCKIPWSQVELYSVGLLVETKPFHAWYCLEGAGHRIRFRTRPEAYRNLDALLRSRCTKAFLHDYVTGWITPPVSGDRFAGDMRERFRRIAARVSRRYTLLGIAQVVLMPAMIFSAIVGMIETHFHAIGVAYWFSDIAANFRRAANARRSYRRNGRSGGG